jgi:hypothetical protein
MRLEAKQRLRASELEEEVRTHRNFSQVMKLAESLLNAQHKLKAKAMRFDSQQRKVLATILQEEVGVDVKSLLK